jgi:hypothetical protein
MRLVAPVLATERGRGMIDDDDDDDDTTSNDVARFSFVGE